MIGSLKLNVRHSSENLRHSLKKLRVFRTFLRVFQKNLRGKFENVRVFGQFYEGLWRAFKFYFKVLFAYSIEQQKRYKKGAYPGEKSGHAP